MRAGASVGNRQWWETIRAPLGTSRFSLVAVPGPQVDALRGSHCGFPMKVLAVITNPPEVRRILLHLIKTSVAPLCGREGLRPELTSPSLCASQGRSLSLANAKLPAAGHRRAESPRAAADLLGCGDLQGTPTILSRSPSTSSTTHARTPRCPARPDKPSYYSRSSPFCRNGLIQRNSTLKLRRIRQRTRAAGSVR
jgi:hypothetical protein